MPMLWVAVRGAGVDVYLCFRGHRLRLAVNDEGSGMLFRTPTYKRQNGEKASSLCDYGTCIAFK